VILEEFSAGQVANRGGIKKLRANLSRLPGKNMGGALRHGPGKRTLDFSTGRAIVGVPRKGMVAYHHAGQFVYLSRELART
jgi:hypothetical protein